RRVGGGMSDMRRGWHDERGHDGGGRGPGRPAGDGHHRVLCVGTADMNETPSSVGQWLAMEGIFTLRDALGLPRLNRDYLSMPIELPETYADLSLESLRELLAPAVSAL